MNNYKQNTNNISYNKTIILLEVRKISKIFNIPYIHGDDNIDANAQNTRRHVCTTRTIYVTLCWNNIVVYLAITQLRAIRISAMVIAFVSSVAPIAVLVGRRFIAGIINISSHMFKSNIANRCSFLIACGCSRLQFVLYFSTFVNSIL